MMPPIAAADVDISKWRAAMSDYLSSTSRALPVALNGKLRDLMFRAAALSPLGRSKAEYRASIFAPPREPVRSGVARPRGGAAIYERDANPRGVRAVVVWRLRQRGELVGRDAVAKGIKYLGSGRGYAKSGYIKAQRAIPRNEAAACGNVPMSAAKFSRASARVKLASPAFLYASAAVQWLATSARDAGGKQAVQDLSIRDAMVEQTREIARYVAKKQQQLADRVSARGVHGVL